MSNLRIFFALVAVAATLGFSAVLQQAKAADEAPYAVPVKTLDEALKSGRISQETFDALRARGKAAIIARLRLPTAFRAEGTIPSLVDQQRQNIAAVQQKVTQQLSGPGVDKIKRFSTIPHIGIRVDTAALTTLVSMPEVEIVLADSHMEPFLGASVPAVGADNVQNFYGLANAGAGQAIAILDSGVDAGHDFFGGRIVSQACYSTDDDVADSLCPGGVEESVDPSSGGPERCAGILLCWHGTHVAGIAAGNGAGFAANGAPPAGVAPGADIISIQVFRKVTDSNTCMAANRAAPCLLATYSDVVKGLERVYERRNSHTIAVANLSLGAGRYTRQADCDLTFWFYRDIVQNLKSAGIYTVAASGNNAQTTGGFRTGLAAPACVTDVVSVGATSGITPFGEQVWNGSQTMGFLTLLAPGLNINSSTPGDTYGTAGGTSSAAPHVSGALAVLRSLFPEPQGGFVPVLTRSGVSITDNRANMNMVKPRLQLDAAVEDRLGYPIPPTRFRVQAPGGTTMALAWDDNSFVETWFRIEYRPPNQFGWSPSPPPPPGRNSQNVTVSGLTPATNYEFRVAACNLNICSPWAYTNGRTLDTRPCTPSNFRLTYQTSNSLSVAWDYVCSNQNPLNAFKIRTNATPNQSQVIHTYPADKRATIFTNLAAGIGHYFYISACNQFCSNESPMLWGVTETPPAPAAPTNLHWCSGFEFCRVGGPELRWSDNATNESEYRLYYTSAPPGAIPPPATSANGVKVTLAANSTGHQPSMQSGWSYSFVVYAWNAGGFSTMSNRVTTTAP